jgi:hypothetical protein
MISEYNKCKFIAKKILNESFPLMDNVYKITIEDSKNMIINNDNLNQARKITKAAIEYNNNEKNENKDIRRRINLLTEIDMTINRRSKDLHEFLIDKVLLDYKKRKKSLSSKVLQYINEIENSSIPASEIKKKLIDLGKEIQNTTNILIPSYKQDIKTFLRKIENEICNETNQHYNYIVMKDFKFDSSLMKTREWTYLPEQIFSRSGAFVNSDYDNI